MSFQFDLRFRDFRGRIRHFCGFAFLSWGRRLPFKFIGTSVVCRAFFRACVASPAQQSIRVAAAWRWDVIHVEFEIVHFEVKKLALVRMYFGRCVLNRRVEEDIDNLIRGPLRTLLRAEKLGFASIVGLSLVKLKMITLDGKLDLEVNP